jgi:hypothetical protein
MCACAVCRSPCNVYLLPLQASCQFAQDVMPCTACFPWNLANNASGRLDAETCVPGKGSCIRSSRLVCLWQQRGVTPPAVDSVPCGHTGWRTVVRALMHEQRHVWMLFLCWSYNGDVTVGGQRKVNRLAHSMAAMPKKTHGPMSNMLYY